MWHRPAGTRGGIVSVLADQPGDDALAAVVAEGAVVGCDRCSEAVAVYQCEGCGECVCERCWGDGVRFCEECGGEDSESRPVQIVPVGDAYL